MEMDYNLAKLGQFFSTRSSSLVSRKNRHKLIMVCLPFQKITRHPPLDVLGAFCVRLKVLRFNLSIFLTKNVKLSAGTTSYCSIR